MRAVEKTSDQGILTSIAKNDRDKSVRFAAIRKLTSQETLAELAMSARDGESRMAAAERLTDGDYITQLAESAGDDAVRRFAVGKIDDQKLLAGIATNDDDESIRSLAISKLTDQRLLIYVVNTTRHWETGIKAIGEIKDNQVLLGFVKTARNKEIREAVIGQISDPKILADVAKNDDSEDVSVAAVKRLTDQPTLVDVAQFGRNEWARLWAVSRISDQAVLEKFARNHKDGKMRGIALREIADENIVVDIATNVDRALIPVALYKLKDTQRLVALVKNWFSNPTELSWGDWKWMTVEDDLEGVALGKFTTEEILADLAKTVAGDGESGGYRSAGAGSFREKCLARVKEQKLLADIIKNADSRAIREKAFERLTDEQLLVDVVRNAKEVEDAHRALSKLAEMPLFSKEALVDVKKSMARFMNIEMLPVPGQSFLMAKTEVTQTQWSAIMGSHSSGGNRPVEDVSWDDAMEFCKKLTEMERATGRLPAGQEYTLPTEKQWEYACRAGTTGDYTGTGNLDDMGWYYGNSGGQTHDVATKKPNDWGFYDMHGNVWEWCLDEYGSSRDGRVLRGGGWRGGADACRSAYRGYGPGLLFNGLGFRPVLISVR